MTVAANDVNEFKRRKELGEGDYVIFLVSSIRMSPINGHLLFILFSVQKYQKVEESGLSTKFQKFTWHSVLKKSSRFNQRITQFTGLVSQVNYKILPLFESELPGKRYPSRRGPRQALGSYLLFLCTIV